MTSSHRGIVRKKARFGELILQFFLFVKRCFKSRTKIKERFDSEKRTKKQTRPKGEGEKKEKTSYSPHLRHSEFVYLSVWACQTIPELQNQTVVKWSSKRGPYWSCLYLLGDYWAENIQCAVDECILNKRHRSHCNNSPGGLEASLHYWFLNGKIQATSCVWYL